MKQYAVRYSKAFTKALKKFAHQPQKISAIQNVVLRLAAGEKLEAKFRDHKLTGEHKDKRECHVMPDLLLIYEKLDDVLVLHCVDVGSHSELFG